MTLPRDCEQDTSNFLYHNVMFMWISGVKLLFKKVLVVVKGEFKRVRFSETCKSFLFGR